MERREFEYRIRLFCLLIVKTGELSAEHESYVVYSMGTLNVVWWSVSECIAFMLK